MIEAKIVIMQLPVGVSTIMHEVKRENVTEDERIMVSLLDACLSASLNFIMEKAKSGQMRTYDNNAALESDVKKFLDMHKGLDLFFNG